MANLDAPKGFRPVRMRNGSPYAGQVTSYLIPSSDGNAVGIGDVVDLAGSSGAAAVFVAGRNCEGMPTVARHSAGTTGQAVAGVVVGFSPDPDALTPNYRRASTNRIALVADANDCVFEVQEDAAATPIVAASVGLNVPIIVGSVSTVTGMSTMEIDSSAVAATATLPVKILRLSPTVGNAFNTAGVDTDNAKFEVIFNTGAFKHNIAGV